MVTDKLPITVVAGPAIFTDPVSQKPTPQEISGELFYKVCHNTVSYNTLLKSDLNQDGVIDFIVPLQKEKDPATLALYVRDGQSSPPPLAKLFRGDDSFQPEEMLHNHFPAETSRFCVADVNQDDTPDILLETENAEGQSVHQVFLNQMGSWATSPLQVSPFHDDWVYLLKRLAYYESKYNRKVTPQLLVMPDKEEISFQLQLKVDDDLFKAKPFLLPTPENYKPGSLIGNKDPEEFLNQRLFPWELAFALRFGAFNPYTFQVEGNTHPIGFLLGAETVFRKQWWGVSAEYDYGSAGIFPDALNSISSGSSISSFPIGQDLPMELDFHNGSLTPFLHKTFFGTSSHTHLMLGLGGFYEHGKVEKKRFDIDSHYIIRVTPSQDNYDAAGLRGRVGATFEKDALELGLDLIFDAGRPLDGEFENFDKYILRGILSVTAGIRYP